MCQDIVDRHKFPLETALAVEELGSEGAAVIGQHQGREPPAGGHFVEDGDQVGGDRNGHRHRCDDHLGVAVHEVEVCTFIPSSVPSSMDQCVMSACQVPLGSFASNRCQEVRGRFWG